MVSKQYSFTEYRELFPQDRRTREFWKLFKIKGSLDNRHLNFVVCNTCGSKIFNDKEKLKFNVDKEGKLTSLNINFDLCEDCVAVNIFQTNSYIFKYGLKRKAEAKNTVSIGSPEDKKTKVDESADPSNSKGTLV